MTTIAVATSRGTELSRIAEMLALYSGILARNTTYIEVLRERESTLFLLPPDTDETMLTRVQILGADPVQISRDVAATIRSHGRKDGMTIVGLPGFAQHLSNELLELFDIFLIPAVPAHPSIADALRLLSETQEYVTDHGLKLHPWIVGAGSAGGPAIAARLRAAAASILAREPGTTLRAEGLPILQWGFPLLHWSTWDALSGLDVTNGWEPRMHVRRACATLYRQMILLARHPERAPSFDELAEDSPIFFEPWLLDDTRGLAQRHLDLAEDLSLIEAGLGPLPDDLSNAAHLDEWGVCKRTFTALEGTVSGHPEQPIGDWVKTSEVMAFGPKRKWARTVSRYYTLSTPAGGEPSTAQDQ